jgi:hypothetical protein
VHFDDEHAGVALVVLHALPQPPQFFTSVAVLTSHPLAGLLSQSTVFATLHVDTSQALLVQTSFAPLTEQECPHVAQLLTSFVVWTSQPFDASLSQFAYPLLHVGIWQADALHDSVPLVVLQGVVHDPQCFESVAVLTQADPAPPVGGQSVGKLAFMHFAPHAVPSHVELPFVGTGHAVHALVPQEPVDTFDKQVAAAPVPQLCVPAGQTQFPPLQIVPPPHALPQAPQFF